MSTSFLRDFCFWCAALNYGVLFSWFVAFLVAHDRLCRLHARWFRLSAPQFDAVHCAGMAVYKIGVLLFNVVPYVAVRIIAGRGG